MKVANSKAGTRMGWFQITVIAACVVVGLFDAGSFIASLPWWLVVLLVLAPFTVEFLRSFTWANAVALVALTMWLLLLPSIRWNLVKGFYQDCRTIEIGATVDDARHVMRSYHLQRQTKGERIPVSDFDKAHLTFHPALDYSADWCVVFTDGNRVTRIEVITD